MAPLTPYWQRPSHGEIQEVIENSEAFSSKSLSRVNVAPFGLFVKMTFPPCTKAASPTYATVQMGRNEHLNLNSDLVYINHSCEPSLIFDMASLSILAGPQGLKPGDELSFFYPSTEWSMDQAFDCFCGSRGCRGRISGAKGMSAAQLEGMWLNGYIRDMLAERDGATRMKGGLSSPQPGQANGAANREAHHSNWDSHLNGDRDTGKGLARDGRPNAGPAGAGPSSRELSGEMGGDTRAGAN